MKSVAGWLLTVITILIPFGTKLVEAEEGVQQFVMKNNFNNDILAVRSQNITNSRALGLKADKSSSIESKLTINK